MKALFDSVGSMGRALSFHRERHSVLSGNVANVDTPGYRPMDLTRNVSSGVAPLAGGAPGHLGSGGAGANVDTIRAFDDGGELASADGNAVNLERELSKIDANRVRYNTTTELVSRRMALLRYAAGDGVG